jgi:hypothetical protein
MSAEDMIASAGQNKLPGKLKLWMPAVPLALAFMYFCWHLMVKLSACNSWQKLDDLGKWRLAAIVVFDIGRWPSGMASWCAL